MPGRWNIAARAAGATLLALALGLAAPLPGLALSPEQRAALDLTGYTVRDRDAGFFDFEARKDYLAATPPKVLTDQLTTLRLGFSCKAALEMPVLSEEFSLPGFYEDNPAWRAAVQIFFDVEDTAANLMAAELVANDHYHGNCLVDMLLNWARQDALTRYVYSPQQGQAWYQTESILFSLALAYASVRQTLPERAADYAEIDAWLDRAARIHLAIPGQKGGTCCNNHFYRRALYATIIGVLTEQDDLFRTGAAAIYSALDDAGPSGELPLEMVRGSRAAHYQNYAVSYLVMIAELLERQGHAAYGIEVNGKTLHDLIAFDLAAWQDPAIVAPLSGAKIQVLDYQSDPQYRAWMEIYLSRFDAPAMEALVGGARPLYNRDLGGFTSLIFYRD